MKQFHQWFTGFLPKFEEKVHQWIGKTFSPVFSSGWLDGMLHRKQRNGQNWLHWPVLPISLFPLWHPVQSPSTEWAVDWKTRLPITRHLLAPQLSGPPGIYTRHATFAEEHTVSKLFDKPCTALKPWPGTGGESVGATRNYGSLMLSYITLRNFGDSSGEFCVCDCVWRPLPQGKLAATTTRGEIL